MSARHVAAASLIELVHSRLGRTAGWEAESKALSSALQLLTQSAGAKRQKRLRDKKRDATGDVTSDATSDARQASPAPSRALPSESHSSILSVSSAESQTSEKCENAHALVAAVRDASRDAERDVTPVLDRIAGVLNGSGTAALSRPALQKLTALLPALEAEARKQNLAVDLMVSKAWRRFRNDPKVRAKQLGHPGMFLDQWQAFLEDAPQRGLAPVSSNEEFEQMARDIAAREQRA